MKLKLIKPGTKLRKQTYTKPSTAIPDIYLKEYEAKREKLKLLLENKTVALIGRAKTFEQNIQVINKAAIDTDVVSFTNYYPLYIQYLNIFLNTNSTVDSIFYVSGKMREVMDNSLEDIPKIPTLIFKNINKDECVRRKLKSEYPNANEFPHFRCNHFPNPDWNFVSSFFLKFECSPLTGFISLKHILQFNPKKIYIIGWNLYNQYTKDTGGRKRGNHNLDPHGKYLHQLVKKDNRIILEDYFAKQLGLL